MGLKGTAVKALLVGGLALVPADKPGFSVIQPMIEQISPKRLEKPLSLLGDYFCTGRISSTSSRFSARHPDGWARAKPFYMHVETEGHGYAIRETTPGSMGGSYSDKIKVSAFSTKGRSFSYNGSMDLNGCKIIVDAAGNAGDNGDITFTEERKPETGCQLPNEGRLTTKASCSHITKRGCTDRYHRGVFIRPCNGQLFVNGSMEETKVGGRKGLRRPQAKLRQ
jgi:hypothetical protein